jgi:hypothetical protein
MSRHPNCPPRRSPDWASAIVDRLIQVDGALTDPKVAYETVAAFTGGSGASGVVAELVRRGLIVQERSHGD